MSAEKEVRLRLASRSSRFAREAGIEIVRRTALIGSEYELGGMTSQPTMRGSALPPAVLRSVFDRVAGSGSSGREPTRRCSFVPMSPGSVGGSTPHVGERSRRGASPSEPCRACRAGVRAAPTHAGSRRGREGPRGGVLLLRRDVPPAGQRSESADQRPRRVEAGSNGSSGRRARSARRVEPGAHSIA